MRPFTNRQFAKGGFVIPNLKDHFRMEVREIPSWSSTTTNQYTFYVKGSAIPLTNEIAISNSEWYELFSITTDGHMRNYNPMFCKLLGLVNTRNGWDGEQAILDGLYYDCNPIVTHTLNGKLRKSVWSQLKRRCNVSGWNVSAATDLLLNVAIEEIKRELPEATSEDIKNYLTNKHIDVFVCSLTDKIYTMYYSKRVRFSTGLKHISSSIDLVAEGYSLVRMPTSSEIWITPQECVIQGRIYLRTDVTWGTCNLCNNAVPEQGLVDGECTTCLENKYKIHNYSTKVPSLLKFKAKNVKPSTIYLGIELEYESTDRDIARSKVGKALAGHAIMKSDGSIHNGFEIVTCPATLEIHMEEFKRFYANFPTELFPQSNTGMHVHVSRKPLNQFTIGKMVEFMNRADNKAFIAYIAGRIDNSYARMDSAKSVTHPLIHGAGQRYSALNLTPTDTIEFRIFSTPANWEEFASRLEFCQALTDYCQPCQVSGPLKQLTGYPSFINWLQSNRKAYPELSNHLKGFA